MRRFGGRHFYIRSAAACLRMKDLYEGVRDMVKRIGGSTLLLCMQQYLWERACSR